MEANLFSFHLRWSRTFKPVSHQKVTAPTCSATMVLRGLPDPLNLVLHQVDSDLNLVFNELVPNSAYSEK